MSNTIRKRLGLLSMVATIAVIALVAAFMMNGSAMAQQDPAAPPPPPPPPTEEPTPTMAPVVPAPVEPDDITVSGWSSSANGSENLTITVMEQGELAVDDSIVLVLEDDFVVPDRIPSGVVFFRQPGDPSGGARVHASVSIDEEDDGHAGDDAHTIRIFVPDMDPASDTVSGLADRAFGIVIPKEAGIKNPSEQKDAGYKIGVQILRGNDTYDDEATHGLANVAVWAKISLSADDGGRGKELTVTGSGFNNGTEAEVFVQPNAIQMWWDGLNCERMNMAVNPEEDEPQVPSDVTDESSPYCVMYKDLTDDDKDADTEGTKDVVIRAGLASADVCQQIIDDGDSLGSSDVGSDDKFTVTYTVHQDEFKKGNVNYICATDNEAPENRPARSVKVFDMTPSVTVSPDTVASGDEVTIKPRDFDDGTPVVSLNGEKIPTLKKDGDSDYVFDMPGGVSGVVQLSFAQGGDTKRTAINVNPSNLTPSQSEVAPNQSIIISGSGFNENSYILIEDIKLDGKSLDVSQAGVQVVSAAQANRAGSPDDAGKDAVQTTSNGEFTATVRIWTANAEDSNPALDDDEYTLKATDAQDFVGKAKITIKEPTVSVSPDTASARDFIVISGENWPITTPELDNEVTIIFNEGDSDERKRSANVDGNGRFRYEYQLPTNVDIGDEEEVVVQFDSGAGGNIEETASFQIVEAELGLSPSAPGETISVEIQGMPPYTLVNAVNIDGADRLGGRNINTNREGDATVADVLVPFLDPGFYPVEVRVGGETRVAQLEVLPEAVAAGVASALPGAVSDLGDNLDAIFHFNNTTKAWTFYDPRPEFAELNTLSDLIGGQPYWVLVKDSQEDVDWNGRLVDFTCAGGDCWNLEIW